MDEPIVSSWPTLRRGSIESGCVTGLLSALVLGYLWIPDFIGTSNISSIHFVFFGGLLLLLSSVHHILIGMVFGWLVFRLDYLILRFLMNTPLQGVLMQPRWRWLPFAGLIILNGVLSSIAVWILPGLLIRLFSEPIAITPVLIIAIIGVTWYRAVEWFLPFSLSTTQQYRLHWILGALVLLLSSIVLIVGRVEMS